MNTNQTPIVCAVNVQYIMLVLDQNNQSLQPKTVRICYVTIAV